MKNGFDVHGYPRRMELAIKKLKENRKVNLHNRFKTLRFIDYLETQGTSLPRRIRYVQNLTRLAAMLNEKDFEEAKRSDIEKVILEHGRMKLAEQTKVLFNVMVKRFYRWLKDPEDKEYPPEVKWIKTTGKDNNHVLPEDLLTEDDIAALIKAAEWSRDKALVSMLYDSGGRIGEVLTLQRRNIAFDEHGAVVVVEGKTGQRRERLIQSVPHMAQWLNDHPDKRPDAPLWIHNRQGCHEPGITPLDYYSARKLLERLKTRSGITKAVNPHAFRHARATYLANYLTEAQLKQMFGWSQESKMAGRYVHLSGRDVDRALLRIHGLETDRAQDRPRLSVTKCARCEHQNPSTEDFCKHCGMPLDLKAALDKESALALGEEDLRKRIERLEEREDERRTAYEILLNVLIDPQGEEVVRRTSGNITFWLHETLQHLVRDDEQSHIGNSNHEPNLMGKS